MPKGKKTCPSCKKEVGPRTKQCSCGHKFIFNSTKPKQQQKKKLKSKPKIQKKIKKKSRNGLKPGTKSCPKCKLICGVRTKVCPSCSHIFVIKHASSKAKLLREKSSLIEDWTTLQKGDLIRAINGGPYQIIEHNDGIPEMYHLGYRGVYRVLRVEKDGILTRSCNKSEAGYCFLYMGPKQKSKHGNWIQTPHILVKVEKGVGKYRYLTEKK